MVTTQIQTSRIGDLVLVAVDGPIRAGDSEAAFVETLREILEGGDLQVALDLSSVPHVDSTGLGRILQAVCRFQRAGGTLKVLRPSSYVRNLLDITKVIEVVEVVDSVDTVDTVDTVMAGSPAA